MYAFPLGKDEKDAAAALVSRAGWYVLVREKGGDWRILRECRDYHHAMNVWANSAGVADERMLVYWAPKIGLEVMRTSNV